MAIDPVFLALNNPFGHSQFKSELQEEVIRCIVKGKQDVFVSIPTGGGKSLCYQLPGVVCAGLSVVFSPLLALIQDQLGQLVKLKIPAASLNSDTPAKERQSILDNLRDHHVTANPLKFLYVTPEYAATEGFRSVAASLDKRGRLGYFVVDEAHCCSEWGQSFRPSYLKLGEIRSAFPAVPWVALTATASSKVVGDIKRLLRLKEPVANFKAPSFRPNLFYEVIFRDLIEDPESDLAEFVCQCLHSNIFFDRSEQEIESVASEVTGSGIVYCRTRDGCDEIAAELRLRGITAMAYHAALSSKDRDAIQKQWIDNRISTIVATISFGMGIDKADVRFVVHWTIPKSLSGFYQEAGRAGRDGQPSRCRVYVTQKEIGTMRYLVEEEAKKRSSRQIKKKSGDDTTLRAASVAFEAMVEFCCGKINCRHAVIGEYFGDAKPDCHRQCDVCFDKAAVQRNLTAFEKVRLGLQTGHNSGPSGSDTYLYGGGRSGARSEFWEDSGDGSGDDGEEQRDKKERKRMLDEEFRKRRKRKTSDEDAACIYVPPGSLKHADSLLVPGLKAQKRLGCVDLLRSKIEANLARCGRYDDAQQVAMAAEFEIFRNSKTSHGYSGSIAKRALEISRMTADRICVLDTPTNVEENPAKDSDTPTQSSVTPAQSGPPLFKSAKTLLAESGINVPQPPSVVRPSVKYFFERK